MYSQNNEEEVVAGYFAGRTGRVLDIGANDGVTFSNSRALLLAGWSGVLLEPSPAANAKLFNLYAEMDSVICCSCGIAEQIGTRTLHQSGVYNNEGDISGLLSCIDPAEKARWGEQVSFTEVDAFFLTFGEFQSKIATDHGIQTFEFITIDAEGYDWIILQQIDLNQVGCQCLCIEHNSKPDLIAAFEGYCRDRYGMREISRNLENIIFAR